MSSVIRGSDNFDSGTVGSTTYGAVGTYTGAFIQSGSTSQDIAGGATYAGSALQKHSGTTGANQFSGQYDTNISSAGLSGTWRVMAPFTTTQYGTSYYSSGFFIRIS